jgi:hypothetical protein
MFAEFLISRSGCCGSSAKSILSSSVTIYRLRRIIELEVESRRSADHVPADAATNKRQ